MRPRASRDSRAAGRQGARDLKRTDPSNGFFTGARASSFLSFFQGLLPAIGQTCIPFAPTANFFAMLSSGSARRMICEPAFADCGRRRATWDRTDWRQGVAVRATGARTDARHRATGFFERNTRRHQLPAQGRRGTGRSAISSRLFTGPRVWWALSAKLRLMTATGPKARRTPPASRLS